MVKITKISLIGLGNMGQNHARVLKSMKNVEFLGFYDPNPTILSTETGAYSDLGAMIAESDGVVVASPTSTHLRNSIMVAESRKACLIEKPLAANFKHCEEILAAFEHFQALAVVGMIERFNPICISARQFVQSGQLGEIMQISTVREGEFRGQNTDSGVGVDLGIHDLDLAEWISQENVVQLSSMRAGDMQQENEDYFVGIGKLSNGGLVQINANWKSVFRKREIVIHGSAAVVRLNLLNRTGCIERHEDNEVMPLDSWERTMSIEPQREEPLKSELTQFVTAVQTGGLGELCTLDRAARQVELISPAN